MEGPIEPYPLREPWAFASFRRYLEENEKLLKGYLWGGWDLAKEKESTTMMGLAGLYKSKLKPPVAPPSSPSSIIDRATLVARLLSMHGVQPENVSIVLPEEDWLTLVAEIDLFYNWRPANGTSRLQYYRIEFLRGGKADNDIAVWFSNPIPANCAALTEEIIRCLSGRGIGELPKGTGSYRMRSGPDSSGEIGVAASTAIGHDRNGNSPSNIPDQLDVVSAQAAIAAYARDKKLPGSVSLAQLRELDDRLARNKRAVAASDDSAKARELWARTPRFKNIKGNRDSLPSESLSRAINQLNVAEDSRAHRDFIGATAQGFTEMLDAGDAPAHRKRAHNNRR